jgi:small subunit ribosomal protein S8e
MSISRDSWHKARKTGGRKPQMHKKRKFEMGRQKSNTKLCSEVKEQRIHTVRTMGGNRKFRALRLSQGNFGWATEGVARVSRIVDVVYNAIGNELVRTKTLVKGAVVVIDATPFRQYYENHYSQALGRKKGWEPSEEEKAALSRNENCGSLTAKKYAERAKLSKVADDLNTQFLQGKLLARIASRPGQSGRADGYILEGAELDFYVRKLKTKQGT